MMEKNNKGMRKHSFDEIHKLDKALFELASYAITKGMMIFPHTVEEATDLQDKTASKFNEFKRLIQNGECTFDFIKQRVLACNGPFHQTALSIEDEVEQIADPEYLFIEGEEEPFGMESIGNTGNVLTDFINEILGGNDDHFGVSAFELKGGFPEEEVLPSIDIDVFRKDSMSLPEVSEAPEIPEKVIPPKPLPKKKIVKKKPTSKKKVVKKTTKKKTTKKKTTKTDSKTKRKPKKNDDKK